MKKVLFITTVSGFLYHFEMSNVRILQDMGYEVHYAANGNTQVYKTDETVKKNSGVIFHHVDISKSPKDVSRNLKAKNELVSLIRMLEIDLIHCHTPVGGMLGRLVGNACRDTGVKVIYTTHGFHYYNGAPVHYKLFDMVERRLAGYSDAIVTINREDFKKAQSYRLRQGGRVYMIPGEGTDISRFSVEKKTSVRHEMRERLNLGKNDFFLLSVGELSANKNHKTVIKSIAKIKDKRVKYGICGAGPLKNQLREMIVRSGLQERVKLFGYRSNIDDYLYAADAFVFPSVREGLGMAAIEALASGLPVIASDNRGTREYMHDGENGYVCPSDSPSMFVKSIEKIRNMQAEERKKMETFCKDSVKRFDIQNVRPLMEKIYKEIDRRL